MNHLKSLMIAFIAAQLIVVTTINAHDAWVKKVQIVINTAWGAQYSYWANNLVDGTISYDPTVSRALGSYTSVTGLIFKEDTLSKNQATYSVDKHGKALNTNKSIGSWMALENAVADINFGSLPSEGTRVSLSFWNFFFDKKSNKNNFYTEGRQIAGESAPSRHNNPILKGRLNVNSGTGIYSQIGSNVIKSKTYLAADSTMLIDVEFENYIEIKE